MSGGREGQFTLVFAVFLLSSREAINVDSLLSLAHLTEINMGPVCFVVKGRSGIQVQTSILVRVKCESFSDLGEQVNRGPLHQLHHDGHPRT